jgi:hypothetical protein
MGTLASSVNCPETVQTFSVADPDPNPDPRIHMFSGLPDPDPLVRGMDPDPDPALDSDPVLLSSCKNSKKNLDSYYFVTLFDFLSLK